MLFIITNTTAFHTILWLLRNKKNGNVSIQRIVGEMERMHIAKTHIKPLVEIKWWLSWYNLDEPTWICHNCFQHRALLAFLRFMMFCQHIMSSWIRPCAKLNLNISGAFSPPVSDSPLCQWPPAPPTSPSFKCPKRVPSSHFIPRLHPSHVLKCISPYLFALVSPLHSLPPSGLSLCCSPCSVTVSSHSINQACEARAQCSTASHSPSPVPSVPVSLPHSLSHFKKSFRLPDIVCFHPHHPHPHPSTPSQDRTWEGLSLSQGSV